MSIQVGIPSPDLLDGGDLEEWSLLLVLDLYLMIRNGGDAQVCGCADLLMEKCFGGCAALALDWKGDR